MSSEESSLHRVPSATLASKVATTSWLPTALQVRAQRSEVSSSSVDADDDDEEGTASHE